jgi:hypothetical protein
VIGRSFSILASLSVVSGLAGCGSSGTDGSGPPAVTRSLAPAADTFLNGADPDNNDGGSGSIFTGHSGQAAGVMRGLVRFDFPADLQGHATLTSVRLTLTSRGLGPSGTTPPAPAVESLQAVTEAWAAGDGVGDAVMTFVVGQPCGGTITGATWNQPSCGASDAVWMAAGGTVAAAISGQAAVPATAADTAITWDGATAGNEGMIADAQRWNDDPTTNFGWRITSSTEAAGSAQAQRFYSSEAGAHAPSLSLGYTCKAGYGPGIGTDGNTTCLATTSGGSGY